MEVGLENVGMYLTGATFDKVTKNKHNVSEKTFRNLPNLLKDPLYIFKSSTVEGSFVGVLDDVEESKGIKKTLIAIVKPIKNKIAINLIPSVYGKDPDFPYREVFKNNLLYEKQNKKTVLNNVVASIATEALKRSDNIINDVDEKYNPNIVKKEEEREMALLDELKKLVASVENAKEDFYTTYQKGKCIKK